MPRPYARRKSSKPSSGLSYKLQFGDISKLLKRLTDVRRKKVKIEIWKKVLRAAGNLIVKNMRKSLRSAGRVDKGALQKSIIKKIVVYSRSNVVVMIIGVQAKKVYADNKKPSKYGWIIRAGRKRQVVMNKNGKLQTLGAFKGVDFIGDGLKASASSIYSAMGAAMEKTVSALKPV